MGRSDYSAAHIRVLEAGEAVRSRPAMYFGASRDDPNLASRVVGAVLSDLLHSHAQDDLPTPARVRAEISSAVAFSVSSDQTAAFDDDQLPRRGCFGVIGPNLWAPAAAAALSSHAVAEIWYDGRGFRQLLTQLPPDPPIEPFTPERHGRGVHITYELDTAFLGADASITTALDTLICHDNRCPPDCSPGEVTILDRRTGTQQHIH
ncbi:hypothetical protein [Nocardia sp. NPDC051832]|uniref:hypothetical protein n=1 Tax=Nocardia sp. NPDC051832 TaxID=3155673 RepID=UPI003423EB14